MLQKIEPRDLACPACGQATPHRHLYTKNACDILRCEACGLGRAQTAGFDPTTYYTGDYFNGQYADGYADYRSAEPVLRREFAKVVAFIRGLRPNGRLLELGCAYGFFLQEAKPYYDVAGVELAEAAAAHCRKSGLDVMVGVADARTFFHFGIVDVIVLLDVIEHLPDPRATLALCAQHLNPGGIVVITTGDFASTPARLMGSHWRLMTPPQHLWFFTREGLRRMAESVGMQLVSADHPWKIVPLSLILFQLGRMLGLQMAPPATGIGLPVNLFDAMRVVLRKPERP